MSSRRLPLWMAIAIIMLIALNLRGPIVALAPVVSRLQDDLGMSAGTAGFLTSIPVLCFALLTPFASLLIGRIGPERATLATLAGVLLGSIIRSAGGPETVALGMVIIGAAISIGNVVLPMLIYREVPMERVGAAMGLYVASMNLGSVVVTITVEPLADALGWRWALASWVLIAGLALALWIPTLARRRAPEPLPVAEGASGEAPDGARRGAHPVAWRSLTGWMLTLAFGCQSFAYYSLTAWAPSFLTEQNGMSPAAAGGAAALFQGTAILGALGIAVLMRKAGNIGAAVTVASCWLSVPTGLLLAPELWWLWLSLGGLAQAGCYTVMFTLITQLARSARHARGLSAFVQTGGYIISSFGPPTIGALYAATGGWTAPMTAIIVVVVVLSVLLTSTALRSR